jgi:hypothetical protein
MASEYETRVRKVKKGETIEYDCGCSYRVEKVDNGVPVGVAPEYWCDEHDPTLWGNSPSCK